MIEPILSESRQNYIDEKLKSVNPCKLRPNGPTLQIREDLELTLFNVIGRSVRLVGVKLSALNSFDQKSAVFKRYVCATNAKFSSLEISLPIVN